MRVCLRCGEVYRECVDFCLEDGEVLQVGPAVNDPVRFPPTRNLGSDPTLALIQQVAAAVAASVAAANAEAASAQSRSSSKRPPPPRITERRARWWWE